MKTLKLTKILSLVLACVLLMGAFGTLPVFAADSDATIEIVGKNIAFDDTISLAYLVECSDPDAEIEVLLYDAEGTLLGKATETKDQAGNVCYISAGVPAHKINTVVTAVATIKGTDIKSAPLEYSVLEYIYERLEVDAVEGDEKAMLDALLTYAIASEIVLATDVAAEDRISEYTYFAIAEEGKDVDGQIVKKGDKVVLPTIEVEDGYTLVWSFNGGSDIKAEDIENNEYTVNDVTIAVPSAVKGEVQSKSWKLVTDVSALTAGTQIVIVAKDYNYALSTTQNKNNRGQVAVTKNDTTVTFGDTVQTITIEAGTKENTFAFNVGNGYLYAASSSKNYLRTETNLSDNSSWTITIAEDGTATVVAQGTNSRNTMQYNQSDSLFACYGSASQKAICIYALTVD